MYGGSGTRQPLFNGGPQRFGQNGQTGQRLKGAIPNNRSSPPAKLASGQRNKFMSMPMPSMPSMPEMDMEGGVSLSDPPDTSNFLQDNEVSSAQILAMLAQFSDQWASDSKENREHLKQTRELLKQMVQISASMNQQLRLALSKLSATKGDLASWAERMEGLLVPQDHAQDPQEQDVQYPADYGFP